MPKRLLRGVIDFGDGRLPQDSQRANWQRLVRSGFEWLNPDERKLADFVKEYTQENLEPPNADIIRDFFERGNELTVVDRLQDLKSVEVYGNRTHYASLLKSLTETQNLGKFGRLLKETEEIAAKGLIVNKETLKGTKAALVYFNQHVYDAIPSDSNARTEGEVLSDAPQAWEEYQFVKANRGKAYGRVTGLDHVDVVCHGCKKGEMWVHAAYAGELKCLPGNATVFDHRTNRRRQLKELFDCGDSPIVTALRNEGLTAELIVTPASHLVQNGDREVFDLKLASGRCVGATSNHKFLTPTGWLELGDLKEGDFVATPKALKTLGTRTYTKSEVKLVGYLLGDGRVEDCICFTQESEVIRKDFIECLKDLGLIEGSADYERPNFCVEFPENRTSFVRVSHGLGDRWHRVVSPVRVLLERLGLYGKDSYSKRIPSEFFGLSEDLVADLLGALWSTDGSCSTGDYLRKDRIAQGKKGGKQSSYVISYSSVSQGLCLDIQSLLLRLGIQSTVTPTHTTVNKALYLFWTLRVVTNPSKRLFCECIRVVGKEDRFKHLASRLPDCDSTPVPASLLPEGKRVFMNGYWRYVTKHKKTPSSVVLTDVAKKFGVSTGDIYWDRVKSVVFRGVEMTYDLEVPDHHTFVVNDIITHNTTFAMNWAYNLVTRYRSNVLYVSLEMKYEHLLRLACALHTSNGKYLEQGYKALDYRKIRDGELSPDEEVFYQEVLRDFETNQRHEHFKVWAPDHDVTIGDIRVYAELMHKSQEVGLIVIDHGGLVKAAKGHKDYTVELNSVLRDAKKLALHFNGGEGVPVLMLFQINRQGKEAVDKKQGKEGEGIYSMSALSYSNEAEKSADYITTTYLNEDLRRQGATILANLKNRDNELFSATKIRVDFSCRRLFNWDLRDQTDIGCSVLSQDDVDAIGPLV